MTIERSEPDIEGHKRLLYVYFVSSETKRKHFCKIKSLTFAGSLQVFYAFLDFALNSAMFERTWNEIRNVFHGQWRGKVERGDQPSSWSLRETLSGSPRRRRPPWGQKGERSATPGPDCPARPVLAFQTHRVLWTARSRRRRGRPGQLATRGIPVNKQTADGSVNSRPRLLTWTRARVWTRCPV